MVEQEPVFAEPWQAQSFALAVELSRRGYFTWKEWTAALAREIAGDHGGERGYSHHWQHALERLLEERGLIGHAERLARIEAWDRAARRTPHGQPIELDRESHAAHDGDERATR